MQNKYKVPDDVRRSILAAVAGYERRKKWIAEREDDICSLGGSTAVILEAEDWKENEYCYLPTGHGGNKVSTTEQKAAQLDKLYNTINYKSVQAIDKAMRSMPFNGFDETFKAKLIKNIFSSCAQGKRYTYAYRELEGISHSTFYKYRQLFIYLIAYELDLI